MSSRAGEANAIKQLSDKITKHCGRISVAKKETSELVGLCATLSNLPSDRPLTPQQSNDIKSELVKAEEQLATWSKYNYPNSLMNKRVIETGVTEFVKLINRALSPPQTVEPEALDGPYRLPPVKRLNGKLKKIGGGAASTWEPDHDLAFTGGPHCEVWIGLWDKEGGGGIGGETVGGGGAEADKVKVALKVLRITKMTEKTSKKLEDALPIWAGLSHKNVLPFYGTVEIEDQFYMVSPWRENGNPLAYVKKHTESDKNKLLSGSAEGLSYLHAKNVVHGSVRCNNVLVSLEGHPQICDFGIAGIMEGQKENATSGSKTVSSADVVRYAAPELIETNNFSATKESDTYSFAMLILECVTEDAPFSNITRDAAVIHAKINKKQCPSRPDRLEGKEYDELWELMNRCWLQKPNQRPSTEQVHSFFGS